MLNFWGKGHEVIGMPFAAAVPELSGQPFEALLLNVWSTSKTYEAREMAAELPLNGKMTIQYFDFIYKAIQNEDGTSKYILHTATDVTERRRLGELVKEKEPGEFNAMQQLQASSLHLHNFNESLIASEYRISELVSSTPVGMVILKGKELYIEIPNKKMLDIWGRKMADVKGQKLLCLAASTPNFFPIPNKFQLFKTISRLSTSKNIL